MNKADYPLFILASLLIVISIVFSYSLSIYTVTIYDYNQFHFFLRQLIAGIISIFIMWGFCFINPRKIVNTLGLSIFVIFLLILMIMPFLPAVLVTAAGGANRWIRLPGISISPEEFFKIGFIYFLAWSFRRKVVEVAKKIPLKEEFKLLLPYFAAFMLVVFLIAFLQKDLGQVVLLGLILIILLIFANRSFKIFLSLGLGAILGIIALIAVAPHRIERFYSWWSMVQGKILSIAPAWAEQYLKIQNLPEPYQVSNSLNAIHHGGFFGVGIANGVLKLGFLSEVHTDFVLAGMAEEIGIVGLGIVIFILLAVVWRIFRISRRVQDATYHLFCLGIGLMIILAFLINSYGISGLIPIKGIAVPFLSYGGSALISVSISVGMVLSISKEIPVDLSREEYLYDDEENQKFIERFEEDFNEEGEEDEENDYYAPQEYEDYRKDYK